MPPIIARRPWHGKHSSQDPFRTYWDRDYRSIYLVNLFLKDRRGYNTRFLVNSHLDSLVKNRLQAGMVWVNNPMIDNDALPFGGWKASGLGRELGRMGLDTFRRSKMVIMDHRPVRQDWWYPYPDDWFLDQGGGRKHA